MLVCDVCGWKNPRKDYYEKHLLKHTAEEKQFTDDPVEVAPSEVAPSEEAPVEQAPVESPVVEPAASSVENEVVLTFAKPIEITINGKHYFGKEITVPDMRIASELVRIAREAYGIGILV